MGCLYAGLTLNLHYRGQARANIDSNAVCIFGENRKNPTKCVLMTFGTKREEKVFSEFDYRMGCAMGCVNGESAFNGL